MYNIVIVLYLTIQNKKKKNDLFCFYCNTCLVNSIISSFNDPIGWGEFVANSHLSKIIVNNGKSGWLNKRKKNYLKEKICRFYLTYIYNLY